MRTNSLISTVMFSTSIRRLTAATASVALLAACATDTVASTTTALLPPSPAAATPAVPEGTLDATTTTSATTTTNSVAPVQMACVDEVIGVQAFAEDEIGVAFYCFGDDALIGLVPRTVPQDVENPIRWAYEQLVDIGPTAAEREAGYFSTFSIISEGALNDVHLDGSTLIVDLAPIVENETGFFTTSGGIWALVSATGLQFPQVETVELHINGVRYCEFVDDLNCG